MTNKEVIIGRTKITFKRLNLKEWTILEENKVVMQEAVEKKDFHGVFDTVSSCISTASDATLDWENQPWFEMLEAYGEALAINSPTKKFPILTSTDEIKEKKLPWEYPGRIWYFWLHLLSNNYGWAKEQIEILDIDDAIGLYQEILIDQQLGREWEWLGYEAAFPYNTSTKKSTFKPLTRPMWMAGITAKPKTMKMLKILIPVGNVIGFKE